MGKKDLLKYYNKKKPVGGFIILVLAIFLFPTFISLDAEFGLPFIIMVVCGGYSLFRFFKYQTDQAVDDYCMELAKEYHREQKKAVASYKIEIEKEVLYSGYLFENMFSARKARTGKDGIVRSSILEMACAYISKDMICNYNKRCSLISEEKTQNQREFCISDIQMIAIEEVNQIVAVALTVTGNEKVYLKCNSREQAMEVCEKIKNKMQGGQPH